MTSNQMISGRGALLVASVICAVAISGSAATAQIAALAPQGDFSLTVSLVESANAVPVAFGDGQMVMAVSQTARLFSDSGQGGFLDFAVGSCASYQIVDFGANTAEISGYCSYRDADGDEAHEQFGSDGAVSLDAIALTGTWLGGTGKYESLEGDVKTELFASVQEGNAVLIGGRKTGSYAIANAMVEPPPPPAANNDADLLAALIDEGSTIYRRNCAGYGREGEGTNGPVLAGNTLLSSRSGTLGSSFQATRTTVCLPGGR